MAILLQDRYDRTQKKGEVVGSVSPCGAVRLGADSEAVLSIDNGALRIRPLLVPGWGRSGLVYGPYERQNGLTLMVHLLNGHHASHTGSILQPFARRIFRWLRGSGTYDPLSRLIRWLLVGQKKLFFRQLQYWYKNRPKKLQTELIDTNLAVGWFTSEIPQNPPENGNSIYIKSSGAENGLLETSLSKIPVTLFSSLQNIPLWVFIILRKSGALYYAATFPDVPGMVSYPRLQPLAIDPFSDKTPLYGGFFQSVLGEIGFRVDTRIFGTQIALLQEYDQWYGTAHGADSLIGNCSLDSFPAEKGGPWNVHQGNLLRTESGISTQDPVAFASLSLPDPSGLIHAMFKSSQTSQGQIGIFWRYRDAHHYFALLISESNCELRIANNGKIERQFINDNWKVESGIEYSLQIIDRGASFQIILNGSLLFDRIFKNDYLSMESGIGIYMENPALTWFIHSIEAHPRSIEIPGSFEMANPQVKVGHETIIVDDFLGKSGNLGGSTTKIGVRTWERILGKGDFLLNGGECTVDASVKRPFPGRTAYVVDWDYPDFADLTVVIHPPGVVRGRGDCGRGGLIFYQDPDNYIIVSTWLDDFMDGASISSFFQINGFEDIYDAVWTNVGKRIYFGKSYRLRVTFDGLIYTAYVNNEPVIFRSLRDVYPETHRLKIHRVGIVANWEWGNDTGSSFNFFEAKR